jgi:hypothetical protein
MVPDVPIVGGVRVGIHANDPGRRHAGDNDSRVAMATHGKGQRDDAGHAMKRTRMPLKHTRSTDGKQSPDPACGADRTSAPDGSERRVTMPSAQAPT